MKLGSHSWGKLVSVGMCGLCLAAYPAVTREISGSSYVVNVDGTDADEALTQADYAALLGGGTPLDLVKTGKGRLYIPFEMTDTVDAARNWQGSTIVSNGFLRADFVGSLGDGAGSLTVVPGASFECNWTAAEVGTPMQKRHIYVGGCGVDDERGALRSWTGDTYAFGLLDFTADTYVNDKRNGSDIPGGYGDACIGVRYNDIFLNGHSVTVGGAMHLAAFAGLYGPGRLVADNWTSLSFEGAVSKHDPSVRIEIRWGAELKLTVYSETADDYYTMPVKFESNTALAALPVWNAQAADRVFLNGWGGPVELSSGTVNLDIATSLCELESTAGADKVAFRFKNAVTGPGTLDVRRGIAWFLSEANAFGGLALSTYGDYSGRVKLRTAESVLRVRSFTIDGAAQANGTYTPQTNPGRILQGTIVVDPAAPVTVVSATAGEQIARLDRTAGDMNGTFAVNDGRLDVSVTGGGAGVLRLDDNAVARLLGSAFAHLDASREETCVFESTSDASGNPHVGTWKNLNGNWGHGEKWTGEYLALPNDYGTNWIRGVKAPPTWQSYRFNGVTMKYVDFGTCEKVNMNHCAKSETASAMKFNLNPVQEVHVVHADAHLTDAGIRNVLFGITWYSPDNYNYAAGRRGGNATFFDTANNPTVAYRDGRLYVDNVLRANTFVPAEDDVHVYTIMPNTAFADPPTSFSGHNPGTLCCDGWTCYGGARIGEVVVYETKNTEADRAQIDAYLLMKWTGQGNGPQIPFGRITLADGVSLSLAGYTRDFVRGQVSVRGLAGNGTVSPGATALSCADLSTSFASATACGRVHVAGTFAFPATGTLTVSSSVKPKVGEYVVFSAEALSGGENLADWTVRLEGACALRQDVRVFVRGNEVVLAVPQAGCAVLVR